MTKPAKTWDLWTKATGGARVYERPKLYGGTPLKILALQPKAVFVRTSDGVTGWIRASAAEALTTRVVPNGEQARWTGDSHAVVVHQNAIPLRDNPRSTAKALLNLQPGNVVVLIGVRGDWLRVFDPARGSTGWARWHYDGALYLNASK